jgi:hypothetical protein
MMVWVAMLAVLCALPVQLSRIVWYDPVYRSVYENEMRARQRLDYAANDPRNAALHLAWHDHYEQEAQRWRSKIGWGRLTSLAFVGLEVGFLAWQFGLRWLAALTSILAVVELTILAEVIVRFRWEETLALALFAFIFLPLMITLTLVVGTIGAGLAFAIRRRLYTARHCCDDVDKPAPPGEM